MMNKIDSIINACNYERLCDFSVIPPEGKFVNEDFFKKNGIIFCKTDFLNYLFSSIHNSDKEYVLVTHHSDYPIDEIIFSHKPKCIKKWFAINPTFHHDDLISIPLGIKTHCGIYLEPQYMTSWFAENIDEFRTTEKTNNIYCNWNLTNLDRQSVLEKLKQNNLEFTHETGLSFKNYIKNMARHKFVISPPGNGIDCHRTWESLYVGSIPVVIDNYIYKEWDELPILKVSDYSELTQNVLDNFYKKQFNFNKLYLKYWEDRIRKVL
jgi:hypothetical protein